MTMSPKYSASFFSITLTSFLEFCKHNFIMKKQIAFIIP